ncbi:reverse transcriptase domain-containing protein [Tanacetum coccineum]
MPFGLKNVKATYQRLVDKAFQKQIGGNLEVYVDDLVIKSRTEQEIIRDIKETFRTLREINMKLNPKKCTFGVEEAAFKQMKKIIVELPTLTAPMENEELIMYLGAAREAVSAVLMTKRKARQMPVYFVSRALQANQIGAIKTRNYRKIAKWSIKLGEYDIQYRPRISVKGQILTDFIVERPEDDSLAAPMEVEEELPDLWALFTDRSFCIDGSGAGLILTDTEGTEFTYALRFKFDAINNEVEYEALIADLGIAEQMGVKNLQTHMDSRLVANQINGSYIANELGMIQYCYKSKKDSVTTNIL